MNRHRSSSPRIDISRLKLGILAGLAGGAAEVAWILLHSAFGNVDAATVAQGVTFTFSSTVAASSAGVVLGIVIHMLIAVLLGIAIAICSRAVLARSRSALLEPCFIIATLVGVWGLNFYLVLPLINPEFVTLLPLEASLVSKVFFGVAAAFVLSVATHKEGHSEFVSP
jgi:hypothetical protein